MYFPHLVKWCLDLDTYIYLLLILVTAEMFGLQGQTARITDTKNQHWRCPSFPMHPCVSIAGILCMGLKDCRSGENEILFRGSNNLMPLLAPFYENFA